LGKIHPRQAIHSALKVADSQSGETPSIFWMEVAGC
jgi:hypothetical protein